MHKKEYYNKKVLYRNALILLEVCAQVKYGESVFIIIDETTHEIEDYLVSAAKKLTDKVEVRQIFVQNTHGIEPAEDIAKQMRGSDVILAATKSSLAHTKARFQATNQGARYLSLPDYGLKQLSRPSLTVDFFKWAELGKIFKKFLDRGQIIRITTAKGTDLTLDISNRVANWCPGFCNTPGMMGSPPDMETNIPPQEDKSEGTLVVDGSIPCSKIGLVKKDLRLLIKNGTINYIDTNLKQGKTLEELLDYRLCPKRKILAEFGIGFNPKAKLCGLMLEDEGALGTVHFGFGSNATIGGKNNTNFHLDFVIKKPTVHVDGMAMIKEGSSLAGEFRVP